MDQVGDHLLCSRKRVRNKKEIHQRKYQFGAAHRATQHPALITLVGPPESNTQLMSKEALNGYFDNLAEAATKDKAVLEEFTGL